MNYLSPASGRHFVVISAGGNSSTSQKGDYVVATFSSAEEIARTPTFAVPDDLGTPATNRVANVDRRH